MNIEKLKIEVLPFLKRSSRYLEMVTVIEDHLETCNESSVDNEVGITEERTLKFWESGKEVTCKVEITLKVTDNK